MSSHTASYLGFDLSSQGLKCVAVTPELKAIHEEAINFDTDLPHYGTQGGTHKNEKDHEVYAPVAMWIEALDLILTRMKEANFDFSKVKGVSGAGQQHGSVYWSAKAEELLGSLDPKSTLVDQLKDDAFTHPWSPNWQDHSTQEQCELFEGAVGGPEALAQITGSKAHHRFTGPQILRFHHRFPEVYQKTARISLVSSFLCSVFLGKIAPLDISDVCGMNLWDISGDCWSEPLLAQATEGESGGVESLKTKLGSVEHTPGARLGSISSFYTSKFNFSPDCAIYPFTGDNPSTILSLPLRSSDVILSLGTSTTLLMVTPTYHPSLEYHLFNHPTTAGLYMFMLCYCNGALAREGVRDQLNTLHPTPTDHSPWESFNTHATRAPDFAKIGVFFPLPEIIPKVNPGTWRYLYNPTSKSLHPAKPDEWRTPEDDARAILESQALSMRLRSAPLLTGDKPMPRRIYVVGGGSRNPAIVETVADVLGAKEGVFKLEIGGNACALGAGYYAVWAGERGEDGKEGFEDFVSARWDEERLVQKWGVGYKEGVWERYGEMLEGYERVEKEIVEAAGQ